MADKKAEQKPGFGLAGSVSGACGGRDAWLVRWFDRPNPFV